MSRYAYETLVVLLLFAWILGWLVWPVEGILIHFLLILALAVVAIRLLGIRRTIP
jgi:hypothetical protein